MFENSRVDDVLEAFDETDSADFDLTLVHILLLFEDDSQCANEGANETTSAVILICGILLCIFLASKCIILCPLLLFVCDED